MVEIVTEANASDLVSRVVMFAVPGSWYKKNPMSPLPAEKNVIMLQRVLRWYLRSGAFLPKYTE